ncbi:right-handed parallel beta-helix repeat-containing protein [Flavicella sediminum]|uniref:right-handed parallel beta-helix repeat-containing protein n=1 Tax=Flavicella sediminum TaxID=2585141 RepID=UPI00111F8F18|nr:right-handed parallel beta-helix repeat-containing protein [Flavicella sediminum]
MRISILNFFIVLILLTSCSEDKKEFYVSLTGNDKNPGTKTKPVATFLAARNLIRDFKSKNEIPEKGITVWVSEGEYAQQKTFSLNKLDSGEPNATITWRAVPGENVSLIGGVSISANEFSRVRNENIIKRFNEGVSKHILQMNLKKIGVFNLGKHTQYGHAISVTEAPLELFVNNEPMTLARYPNEGYISIGKTLDNGSRPREGDYSERGAIFEYTDARHEKWAQQKDVWFQGTFYNGYADDKILVEKIDTNNKQVKLATPHMYSVRGGRDYTHYKALNILEELDEPGEWYVDRETSVLYLWPESDISKAKIAVSILEEPIVALENVNNIVFRDFTVEVGRGIGIYIEGGDRNLVAGCTVRNVGTSGIFMGQGAQQTFPHITHDDYEGVPISRKIGNLQGHIYKNTTWNRKAGTNHKILSCDVYNTGSGGIYLSGGDKKTLSPGNNSVENCKVHDYNRRNKFLWSGINIDGVANKIRHCEIYNSDFQAIYAHGNEHVYEYNHIHHVTQHSDDVSVWYLGRDPSDRGNIIRYNYFHDCGNKNRMNMGIYCDDSTTDVTVFGNVFYNMQTAHGVLYSNTGWDLTMKNNIIINPHSYSVVLSPHYYTWYKGRAPIVFGKGKLFEQRLFKDLDILKPPYSTKYPELHNYMDVLEEGVEWEGMHSKRNVFSTNVIIGGKENPIQIRGGKYGVFENVNNYQTNEDPGFVDFKTHNFMLQKNSDVYKKLPSFKPVPFDKMGLYVDEFRNF